MKIYGFKLAPAQGVYKIQRKIFKNLLQNHFIQLLEICFVALSSGPLLNLFKMIPGGNGFASKIYIKISRADRLSGRFALWF